MEISPCAVLGILILQQPILKVIIKVPSRLRYSWESTSISAVYFALCCHLLVERANPMVLVTSHRSSLATHWFWVRDKLLAVRDVSGRPSGPCSSWCWQPSNREQTTSGLTQDLGIVLVHVCHRWWASLSLISPPLANSMSSFISADKRVWRNMKRLNSSDTTVASSWADGSRLYSRICRMDFTRLSFLHKTMLKSASMDI